MHLSVRSLRIIVISSLSLLVFLTALRMFTPFVARSADCGLPIGPPSRNYKSRPTSASLSSDAFSQNTGSDLPVHMSPVPILGLAKVLPNMLHILLSSGLWLYQSLWVADVGERMAEWNRLT